MAQVQVQIDDVIQNMAGQIANLSSQLAQAQAGFAAASKALDDLQAKYDASIAKSNEPKDPTVKGPQDHRRK